MTGATRKPVRLAEAALGAALARKWDRAGRYMRRINDECGGDGWHLALIAWCDTFVDHATDGAMTVATRVNMNFMRTDTGALDRPGSADVPPRVQWAGRIVQARAAMDLEAYESALDDLPEDNFEAFAHIQAVLECVALTINGLPRGFAVMGRSS